MKEKNYEHVIRCSHCGSTMNDEAHLKRNQLNVKKETKSVDIDDYMFLILKINIFKFYKILIPQTQLTQIIIFSFFNLIESELINLLLLCLFSTFIRTQNQHPNTKISSRQSILSVFVSIVLTMP